MRFLKIKLLLNVFLGFPLWCTAQNDCHPDVNFHLPQYIIGYGSLMLESSKQRTYQFKEKNIPIILSGYKRAWMIHGYMKSQATTFLGIKEDKLNSKLNAVVFKVDSLKQIESLDKRETGYCRKLVNPKKIRVLDIKSRIDGQQWVYIPKDKLIDYPSSKFPISEYYVDIFIAGCLEIEKQYQLAGFTKQCISSTDLWTHDFDQKIPRKLIPLKFDRQIAHHFLINNL
jgi:hypothetical protein